MLLLSCLQRALGLCGVLSLRAGQTGRCIPIFRYATLDVVRRSIGLCAIARVPLHEVKMCSFSHAVRGSAKCIRSRPLGADCDVLGLAEPSPSIPFLVCAPDLSGFALFQYEESLLEMRRVLHACILHAPSNVDAFWAAAAVEGGVSPDPRDVRESTHEAGSPGVFGGRHLALSEELVRVLGLAALDLREEDLPLLGEM